MKFSKLSKFISAGVIAASIATVPFNLPASAQTNTGSDTTTTNTRQGVDNTYRDQDNNFDWGWLGLLGLAGLAGLAGRKRHEEVGYSDPDRTRSTTYR